MYLNAERFIWHNETPPQIDFIPEGYQVQLVTVQAAYWRKANAIHDWFVKNVQDGVDECNTYHVRTEELQELVDTCKKVIADPELAPELLPTTSGFFFGGTEYDEWYFENLQKTIDQIETIFEKLPAKNWDIKYHSSW